MTRDSSGRFLKQSRSEQYKLMHERLRWEVLNQYPEEWKALEPVAEEPSPWWIFK